MLGKLAAVMLDGVTLVDRKLKSLLDACILACASGQRSHSFLKQPVSVALARRSPTKGFQPRWFC
jgi:hypothetical protein